MLKAKNIIYGFCTFTTPNKPKYLISLYRDDNLSVTAVFPTSRKRSGVSVPKHGINKKDDIVVSYVFEANRVIGQKYNSEDGFSFPLMTTIPFDYCFMVDTQEEVLKSFVEPKVVGVLSDDEYIDLLYALTKSSHTPDVCIPIFEKIIKDYYSKKPQQ